MKHVKGFPKPFDVGKRAYWDRDKVDWWLKKKSTPKVDPYTPEERKRLDEEFKGQLDLDPDFGDGWVQAGIRKRSS